MADVDNLQGRFDLNPRQTARLGAASRGPSLSKRPRPDGAAMPPLTVSIRIRAALALSLPTSAGSQRSGAFHSFVPSIHFHGGY